MAAELVVVNGSSAGTRHDLTKGEVFIGRSPSSKVVVNEAEVGWRHCQISQHGERFLITDLRSSIGTYVNGMRSAERWLSDRDQIGIGKTILMFRSGEESKRRDLPLPLRLRQATSSRYFLRPVRSFSCFGHLQPAR